MSQEYKRLVNNESKPNQQESNQDDSDQLKKEQQIRLFLVQKICLSFKQFINLSYLIYFEKILVGFIKLYLIAPAILSCLLFYIMLQCSQYTVQIVFLCLQFAKYIDKLSNISLEHLQNENKIVKHILVILDLENVYIMIKSPNCIVDLLKDRNEILLNGQQFTLNQMIYFNFLPDLQFQGYIRLYIQVFYTLVSIAFITKNYSNMYPYSQNKTIQYWLCNKNFAISLLHGCSFYQLIILNAQILGYFPYLTLLLQLIVLITYKKPISSISPLYYHIINDIPFIKENLTKSNLLKYGYVSFTNGLLICIIQKIILISLTIIGMLKLQFHHSFFIFVFSSCLVFLSVLSLSILFKRYRHQIKLINGQQPYLIDINSEKDLKQLINANILQNSYKYSKLQVINVTDNNVQIKDKIHLLFYCFRKSDIFFKKMPYQRITFNNKSFQSIIINNVLDLHNLDFSNNKQSILNNIYSIIPFYKQKLQNEDIYQKLVKNDIILNIKDVFDKDTCPSLQIYKKYTNEIQSVRAQIQVFNSIIAYYILNNPYQVYYDLYD